MNKKQVFGWSMYDFANTIFSALFITIYFPLFVTLIGGTAFHVGLTFSISMLLAALLVPYLGAIVDLTGRKKFLLFIFTVLCCIFTFMIGFFGLVMVLIIGLLANFFYHACLDVYDSLLINVSTKKNIGFISGLGTGVGYLGAIFAAVVALIIGALYGYESISGIRIIFIITALLFFAFSLFTFALVKAPSQTRIRKEHYKEAFQRVVSTIKEVRKFKNFWLFLLASFLYVDAANTTILFFYLYARDQIGLSLVQFLPLYIMMATSAAIGSVIFGKITDTFGHKRTLIAVLIAWIALILILYLRTTFAVFLTVGIIGGALLGGIWTTTRPILVDLVPRGKIAELFGYQGLTEKFSGVIGPAVFGFVAVAIGFRQALLVVIALFLAGVVVLKFVKK